MHVGAVQRVRRQNHFGVGAGAERRAALLERASQLLKVVDLAVEGDREPAVRRLHRLMPGRR